MEEVARKINEIEPKELQADLMACSSILAGLRLKSKVIKSLLKEEIMKSSVIYQEIKKAGKIEGKIEGKREGKREGRIEGKREGKREEALSLAIKIINQYLGTIDNDLQAKIKTLTLENLEELTLALFNFDCLGDLELWLEDKVGS